MTITELAQKLDLVEVSPPGGTKVVEGCYIGDLLSWVMAKAKENDLWLTVMGNINVIAVARLTDVAAVVICEDAPLDDEAATQAKKIGLGVYTTSKTTYELAKKVGEILK